ncbi:shikimate dehydrogenase family protein [Xanthovirga aplysinae]|uniref:shikimate dehydrogenase family protein n=1 Tax=Xanthovirga aplysinae TaxID=2529853 RepID=UPI0012BCB4D9|nr:shikimate dehydrogenase [Xanthovirga aplysinae]MTI31159.1 shikimate dehydrogenase [Xanthovirga aplysinae]
MKFGLIGKTLGHSFSKRFFTEKFIKLGLKEASYELFEISHISKFPELIENFPDLLGLNVTIPYKEDIIPFLDDLDTSAKKAGAVNVIKFLPNGKKIGYNSDYFGFRKSLENFIPSDHTLKALVLGTGGASKAVCAALRDMKIPFQIISRKSSGSILSYDELNEQEDLIENHQLIINTTPLGMSPHVDSAPQLNYDWLSKGHYLYDLVYNPEETLFMKKGKEKGAQTKNGLEMLHLQAERSWEIWKQ